MTVLYNVDVLAPGITPHYMNQWFYLHIKWICDLSTTLVSPPVII